MSGSAHHEAGALSPTPSRKRAGGRQAAPLSPPLPLAGGDRGEGGTPDASTPPAKRGKFRLNRPTERARALRRERNEIEERLWSRLKRRQLGGFKFVTQVPVAGFHPDFICREFKLVVELDGSQHGDATVYDARRTETLERLSYTVLRFWNSDVLTNMEGVLETILTECLRLAGGPPPSPLPHAGGGARA